jgi:hypothetical protein
MATDRQNLFWTLAHVGLGFVCTLTPFALIVWFYFIFATNFFKVNSLLQKKKPAFFLMFFSYLISFEVLDRMAKTSPFIPYELGKYLLVLMGILGIVSFGIRSQKGLWMAVLMTPALFYDFSGQRVFFDIINYYLAPLAVGLGITFADRLVINKVQLNQILKFIWLGCLASLIFTFIKTPDFEEITFSLKAQFDTTGGHSSNQVSTVLGLGMFLSFYSVFNRLNYSGNRLFDLAILVGFAFQGLLSFSRGGMTVAAAGILLLLFLPENSQNGKGIARSNKSLLIGVISIFALYGVFEVANAITGGNLLLRYQGQTAGTLLGTKEVTADHFVTGRIGIFEKDIDLWMNNLFTGVGCGSGRYIRDLDKVGVAAHVELSRLLAEHGLLGLIFAIIFFILVPVKSWQANLNSGSRIILITLIFIAILTTFHAAMRTFVTPLFMILGCMKIVESKNNPKTSNLKTS